MGTYPGSHPARKLVSACVPGRYKNLHLKYEAAPGPALFERRTSGRHPRRHHIKQKAERPLL